MPSKKALGRRRRTDAVPAQVVLGNSCCSVLLISQGLIHLNLKSPRACTVGLTVDLQAVSRDIVLPLAHPHITKVE